MQSFVIPHPSCCVFYLPVVMGLFAAFLFPKLLLAGAKDRNGFMSPSQEAVPVIAQDY